MACSCSNSSSHLSSRAPNHWWTSPMCSHLSSRARTLRRRTTGGPPPGSALGTCRGAPPRT
eukprot:7026316-Pyramimonas_sp.AAC.2